MLMTGRAWLDAIRRRPWVGRLASLLLAVAICATIVCGWARVRLATGSALAGEVRAVVDDPSVRAHLATRLTDELVKIDPSLQDRRVDVQRGAEEVISSRFFADLLDIAVDEARADVIAGRPPANDRLRQVYALAIGLMGETDPSLVAHLPRDAQIELVDLASETGVRRALRDSDTLASLFFPFAVLAIVLALFVVASSASRSRALRLVIGAIGVAGLTAVLLVLVVRGATSRDFSRADRAGGEAAVAVLTHQILRAGIEMVIATSLLLVALAKLPVLARERARWMPAALLTLGAVLVVGGVARIHSILNARRQPHGLPGSCGVV